MAAAPSIGFDDVLALLQGSLLQDVERGWAESHGGTVGPHAANSLNATKQLAFAGISRAELERVLTARRDGLLALLDANFQLADRGEEGSPDEEPAQEAGEPSRPPQALKLARGFALDLACALWLLEAGSYERLVQWLKFRRIPHHRRYAEDLRRAFERISVRSSASG